MLYGDCEYATRVEEELVDHVGFFSILRDDEDDDVPIEEMSGEEACHKKEAEKATRGVETWRQTQEVIEREMSEEETRHKKEAEEAKEDEERWEENEKETEAEKGKKAIKKEMYDEEARRKEETKKAKKAEKTNEMTLFQSLPTKDNRRGIKEQAWKKLGKDKLVCKDGVTNLFQFLLEA